MAAIVPRAPASDCAHDGLQASTPPTAGAHEAGNGNERLESKSGLLRTIVRTKLPG
jgi:hypothetical protein